MSEQTTKWLTTTLGEIVDILDSERVPVNSTERAKRTGDIPYYGATGQVGFIDDFIFNEELVLLGEDGAPFFERNKKKAYLIFGKSWVNNHAHVLRAKSGVTSNRFVCHYLNQFNYTDFVNGTTRLKLTQANMRRMPITLPPLNEQKRIVAKLDELLPKVEACKERLQKIPTILKRFRQSVLAAAVSGKLTEEWRKSRGAEGYQDCDRLSFALPDSWAVESTSELFSFVTSGSRGWAKYYSDKGAIFIRIGNLEHDDVRLDLSDIQYVSPPKGAEGQRTKIMVDDILVSITADVGMIAHVNNDIGEAYINQHVSLARPKKDRIIPRYLALYLTALNGGREQFKALQRGATKVGLSLDDIRNIWVALPSKEEQEEIVRQHDLIVRLVNERCDITKASRFVEKTRSSILECAFSGKITFQDPTDEPASALLERIRSTAHQNNGKQKAKAVKRGRKSKEKQENQEDRTTVAETTV